MSGNNITEISIGVIGGSGLYQIEGMENVEALEVDTPFGKPSDIIRVGELKGQKIAFLARHGQGHCLLPHEVPYRANIFALRRLGVRYLLSFSAVGSLDEKMRPLNMVLPEQFIDLTKSRQGTFFGNGVLAHVSMADPVCMALAGVMAQAFVSAGLEKEIVLHRGGSYVAIEGPQFSTRAESNWYRQMGASVIGMTNMPEAKLAREAQMAYATLAMVTDYDCWRVGDVAVTAEMAIANLMQNARRAQRLLAQAVDILRVNPPASIAHNALASALVTPLEHIPAAAKSWLNVLLKT